MTIETIPQRDSNQTLSSQPAQPLIRTKLFAPSPRSRLVARPRLTGLLREAAQYPLTLICAPAGYGKTTLLLEWIQYCRSSIAGQTSVIQPSEIHNPKIAWLSLDSGDSNISRFLAYLLAALENTQPGIGVEAQLLLRKRSRGDRQRQ